MYRCRESEDVGLGLREQRGTAGHGSVCSGCVPWTVIRPWAGRERHVVCGVLQQGKEVAAGEFVYFIILHGYICT